MIFMAENGWRGVRCVIITDVYYSVGYYNTPNYARVAHIWKIWWVLNLTVQHLVVGTGLKGNVY